MNQPFSHPLTTRDASYAVPLRQRRYTFSRPWRLGLMALNLVGVLLVSTVIFALLPVAHVMSMMEQHRNQNRIEVLALNAQQPVQTTPTDKTPIDKTLFAMARSGSVSVAVDMDTTPAVMLPNTTFMRRGTAHSGAFVEVKASDAYNDFYHQTPADASSSWYMKIALLFLAMMSTYCMHSDPLRT